MKDILSRIEKVLTRTSGASGSQYLGTGTHTGKAFRYLVVNEEVTISSITDTSRELASFTGVTLYAGSLISVTEGNLITGVIIDSGSVIGYK